MSIDQEATSLAETLTNQPNAAPTYDDKALREELRQLRESNSALQNHVQMMQWQKQPEQQQQAYNPFQGKDPKDSILVEDAMRGFSEFEQRISSQVQSQLAEVKLAARSTDYQDVINKYLPKAAQEDPDLINLIKRSPDPMKAAYLAARGSRAYLEDQMSSQRSQVSQQPVKAQKTDPEADKIISNLKQSGSIAQVSNNATPTGSHPDFSRFSDEEFKAYKSKLKFKNAGR